jgi:hypothetical protein
MTPTPRDSTEKNASRQKRIQKYAAHVMIEGTRVVGKEKR